ncbi:type II secretion system F family protein [Candidatus Poribacteria bacterium]|nr:type II secretion system F family protein [Candidatus Poribacteria bacterium]
MKPFQLQPDELDRLASELASMARASIPMPQGLRELHKNLRGGSLKQLSGHLATALEQGAPLSGALGASPVKVSPEFTALVRCAESCGDMTAVLQFAVEHARRVRRHRESVFTAMCYPAFVLLVMVGTLWFMSNSVIGHAAATMAGLGVRIGFASRMMFSVADMFHGLQGAIVAVLLIATILAFLAVRPLRNWLVAVFCLIPGFESLIGLSDSAVTMKLLGVMLSRGVPLPLALGAAELAVMQGRMRRSLRSMRDASERGQRVAPLLCRSVPATAAYLFRQAEERGDLPVACAGISGYCEDRFERLSKRAIAVLEPMLIFLLAVFIAIVLSGLYLPLFSIPKAIA